MQSYRTCLDARVTGMLGMVKELIRLGKRWEAMYGKVAVAEVLELVLEVNNESGVRTSGRYYPIEQEGPVLVLLRAMGLLGFFDDALKSPFEHASLNPGTLRPSGAYAPGTSVHALVRASSDEHAVAALFHEPGDDKLVPGHRIDQGYYPAIHQVLELCRLGGIIRVRFI